MKKAIILFFGLLFLSRTATSAVTASVEKQSFGTNEAIVLKLQTDEATSMSPDLSVLKDLFSVVSTSVSRQAYVVNGQKTSETTWELTMLPNKKGKIIIPEISIGAEKTNPIAIEISDTINKEESLSDDENAKTNEPLFTLKAALKTKKEPFVQEKIDYVVELIDEGQIQNIALEFEPSTNFIIKEAGEPVVKRMPNGKREVIFPYALFAQSSGELEIPNVKLTGSVFQKPDVNTIFGGGFFSINIPSFMGMEAPINLMAKGEKIRVLPAPKDYGSKWWLPAEDVKISAKFLDLPQKITQGSTLTREISLTAVGLSDSQLPELELNSNEDVRQYPEKPAGKTVVSNDQMIAQQKTLETIIVQKSGEIVLPEVKVPWYDVNTGEIKTAVLKEEKIKVLPSFKATAKPLAEKVQNTTLNKQDKEPKKEGFSMLEMSGAFLAGILIAWLLLKPKKEKKPKEIKEKDIIKTSKKKDLKALREHLIKWTSQRYQTAKVVNLNDVAKIFDDEDLKKALDSLQDSLYNENKTTKFDEKIFRKVFKKAVKKKDKQKKQTAPLPPLYE